MNEIELFTAAGDLAVKVKTLPFQVAPEAIIWGQRLFLRRPDGKYCEGFVAFALGVVEERKIEVAGEPQTCPRRAEGPLFNVEGQDHWETSSWRFTDPAEAAKFNQAEADQKNAEAKAKGHNCVSHPNLRYWLWPGPGPKPRTCSYCGGIHPEDAIRLVREFGFEFDMTTKGYKVYLEPPGSRAQGQRLIEAMRAGKDPSEMAALKTVEQIAPPLKAYRPHFTDAQWRELFA